MASLTYISDQNIHLTFAENIVSTNVEESMNIYKKAAQECPSPSEVTVNLANIKMVDSQGLNLLIAIYQECQRKRCGFKVLNATEPVKKLFTFVKLNEKFGISH